MSDPMRKVPPGIQTIAAWRELSEPAFCGRISVRAVSMVMVRNLPIPVDAPTTRSQKNSNKTECPDEEQHDRNRHGNRSHGAVSEIRFFESLENSNVLNDGATRASMPRIMKLPPKIRVRRMGSTESRTPTDFR